MRTLLMLALVMGGTVMSYAGNNERVIDTVLVRDNICYIGQYPNGEGILYSDSLGIFIGRFERCVPNGRGTHYSKEGYRYYGEFADGRYCGYGRLFSQSGTVRMGDFNNGTVQGIDTIYYRNQDGQSAIYVGACRNGVPCGNGIIYSHHHRRGIYHFQEGTFQDGWLYNGFRSKRTITYSVLNGKGGPAIDDTIYSQMELMSKYESLRNLKPKKFPGTKLTKEQQLFLEGKLSSSQIGSTLYPK